LPSKEIFNWRKTLTTSSLLLVDAETKKQKDTGRDPQGRCRR
jgi:hypothetical protein